MHPKESLFQPLLPGTDCPDNFSARGPIFISGLLLCVLLWPATGMTQIFGLVFSQTQVVSNSSGIQESIAANTEDSNLGVYPNPASNVLSVHLNDASVIDAFSLRDRDGIVISHEDFEIPVHVAQLNLKARPAGEYTLQVRSGDRIFSKKVVKP